MLCKSLFKSKKNIDIIIHISMIYGIMRLNITTGYFVTL